MAHERLNDEQFAAKLAAFLAAAQVKVDAYNAQFDHLKNASPLRVDGGIKYIRIVQPGSGVYCFINRENGDALKADSYKKPHPTPRSNINDADAGASGVNWHGGVYLR